MVFDALVQPEHQAFVTQARVVVVVNLLCQVIIKLLMFWFVHLFWIFVFIFSMHFLTKFCLFDQIVFDSLKWITVVAYIEPGLDSVIFVGLACCFITCAINWATTCSLNAPCATDPSESTSSFIAAQRSVSDIYLNSNFLKYLIKLGVRTALFALDLMLLMLLNHASCIHLRSCRRSSAGRTCSTKWSCRSFFSACLASILGGLR